MGLNIKDEKILYELDKNARTPNSIIAKAVNISKDSVGYRIKNLEKNKIIRGYKTLIDVSKLKYQLFRVYFKLIDTNEKDLEKIINYLKNEKNSWWIAKIDGSWDFAFAHWSKQNKDFYKFLFEFLKKFRKNIKEKLICPIIEYKEYPRKYLTNSKKNETIKNETVNEIKIDDLDINILKSLSKNARISILELARNFSMDSKTIINRIKKLKTKKIIMGYKVDLDVSKLGRDFYTIGINLNNFSKFKEIENEIMALKEFTAKAISIGGYDIEFDLEINNTERYYEIIKKLKNSFLEIREIKYFRIIKNYKISYMPEE